MSETKAEIRARALAKRLEDIGWTVEVKVEHSDPDYYSDGRVMLQARVVVHVNARGPEWFDNRFGFGFVSWLPAKGHRASTRYAGGELYRGLSVRRKSSKKLSLKDLRLWISMEVEQARYAAQRKSQEV